MCKIESRFGLAHHR